mmetsp:Transcript_3843/g.8318  ORF Transcript_3843/g.8318 Transcript_3843/m.8318 type:complete len:243 (+) Transcript_3843:3-731(+)
MFSIFAANKAENVRVIALEPVPEVYEINAKNLARHAPTAKVLNIGASSAPGRLALTHFPHYTLCSGIGAGVLGDTATVEAFRNLLISNANRAEDRALGLFLSRCPDATFRQKVADPIIKSRLQVAEVEVELQTLSQVIAAEGLERVDFLKVDAEGAELDILMGLKPEDWAKVQQCVVEIHDVDGRRAKIEELFKQNGMQVVGRTGLAPPVFLASALLGVQAEGAPVHEGSYTALITLYAKRQ